MAFGNNFERKLEQVHKRALDAVVEDISIIPDYDLNQVIPKCESPIERLLVEAIMLSFTHRAICDLGESLGPSKFESRLPISGEEKEKNRIGEWNFIDAQVEVGKYRADIVVCRFEYRSEQADRTPLIIVECDGHDFHERTKDQAKRDKSRDRFFQEEGHCVLRFTGSEIWQDAWGCASQINRFLSRKLGY